MERTDIILTNQQRRIKPKQWSELIQIERINVEKINGTVRKLNLAKAPGYDKIIANIIKASTETTIQESNNIMNNIIPKYRRTGQQAV